MPKPAESTGSTATLFDADKLKRKGPVRLALERDLRAWAKAGLLDAQADALAQLARAVADSIDLCTFRHDPYGVPPLARELRQTLEAIRPKATPDDELDDLLAALRAPVGDPSHA